ESHAADDSPVRITSVAATYVSGMIGTAGQFFLPLIPERAVRNAPFWAQIITIRLQGPFAYKVFRLLFDMMVGHEDRGCFSGVRRGRFGTEFAGRPAGCP